MDYPTISEYIESIRLAEDNFATLTNLRPVLDDDGNPIMSSGNFAVVFKMTDGEKNYAVKCFIKDQEGIEDNYTLISAELQKVNSPYILSVNYLKKELFVDSSQSDESEFPVLIMDWVEGKNLSTFLQEYTSYEFYEVIDRSPYTDEQIYFELRCLPTNFIRMASWLIKQPFAHGDIKPDNIIIRNDGTFVLVDYDGMFVPAMQGMGKIYTGTPNFRNPLRYSQTLNKDVDNYAISVIALSLCTISLNPEFIEQNCDNCIISEEGVFNLHNHWMFREEILMTNTHFQDLLSIYMHTLSQNELSIAFFDECIKNIIIPREYDTFRTKASEEDLKLYWEDNFGVRYSLDGKKVLTASKKLENIDYQVREGVITICDQAFQDKGLNSITLPDSVIAIGDRAFANNDDMVYCNIPISVKYIYENNPWGGCFNIKRMDCESSNFQIKDGILYSSDFQVLYGMIYWFTHISVDFRTKKICGNAFWSNRKQYCNYIKNITLFNLLDIGGAAFNACESALFDIKNNIEKINEGSFWDCKSLISIDLSNIVCVPESAFRLCKNLRDVRFSNELYSIEHHAFSGCSSLTVIDIPQKVSFISDDAFDGCSNLNSINVNQENINYCSIDGVLFNKCVTKLIKFPARKRIEHYTIPDTVCEICDRAFENCTTLKTITCDNKILKFGDNVFVGCESLKKCHIFLDNKCSAESAWRLGFFHCIKDFSDDMEQYGFSLIKKAAEMNMGRAQLFLANCYKIGSHCQQDKEKYVIWLKRSAKNKYYKATLELAKEYILGKSIPYDYKKALELLNELENAENPETLKCNGNYLTLLGTLYQYGLGVHKDIPKAINYYLRGTDWNDNIAEYTIAQCYEKGIGLEINLDKAKEYYSKAKIHLHGKAFEALKRIESKTASDDLPF